MEILKNITKNKFFFLLLVIWILFNPIFLVTGYMIVNGIPIETARDHFSEIEQFAMGLYFIFWLTYGVIIFIRSIYLGVKEAKKKFSVEKEKTMDEMIDEVWKEHKKEKEI
jgi:TctA family transporter